MARTYTFHSWFWAYIYVVISLGGCQVVCGGLGVSHLSQRLLIACGLLRACTLKCKHGGSLLPIWARRDKFAPLSVTCRCYLRGKYTHLIQLSGRGYYNYETKQCLALWGGKPLVERTPDPKAEDRLQSCFTTLSDRQGGV